MIVVVDGWADAATIELAGRLGMEVLTLERGGPARARNHGAAAPSCSSTPTSRSDAGQVVRASASGRASRP
ncbi:MAG: hypothetical protein WKF75_15210 [Singulisphaera sp.]